MDSIITILNPFTGFSKRETGLPCTYHIRVGRRRVQRTAKDSVHEILTENVTARLAVVFPRETTETGQLEALGKRIHRSPETIRRILAGVSSPRLSTIADIAHALDMTVGALLSAPVTAPKPLPASKTREQDEIHRPYR